MFEFAWPWLFLLLPLPWLIRRVLPPVAHADSALQVSFVAELAKLAGEKNDAHLQLWRRQAPFALIWLLLVIAAARPQWLGEPLPVPASGRDLLLAVDVSGSMSYPDMQWQQAQVSRLEAVKHLLGDFLAKRQGDRVGLILFGSQPYLLSPLTFDRNTVRTWLAEVEVGIAGTQTALGDAIGLALKQLMARPAKSRVLILITDGANNGGVLSPALAAELAHEQKVRIYSIGIGANRKEQPLSGLNLQPAMDLDEATLKMIAHTTEGQYFHAQTTQDLAAIQSLLDELEPVRYKATLARTQQALYIWPLALALLGALLMLYKTQLSYWLKPKRGPHA